MTDIIVVSILMIHFFADFVLQTSWQAENKSTNNLALFYHVGNYSLIWLLFLIPVFGFGIALLFSFITFISHFTIDFFTSRISKSFFDKKDYHNGFVTVGFDQVLHYLQIYYTLKWVSSMI